MPATILVVDDEPRMVEILQLALEAAGHQVLTAPDAAHAWRLLTEHPVSLVVLDVMLPGTSGIELCRRIRDHSAVPVVLLTALSRTSERVAGLEAGADDYLTKPFSPRELVLRVAAILRRAQDAPAQPLVTTRRTVGDLVLDAARADARRGVRELHLTPGEFRLLWLLTERPGSTVGTDLLLEAIGVTTDAWRGRGALRTAIYRLRAKLESEGEPAVIVTEHGRGYRFVTSPGSG
ncbi:MAG: response regulator transcription factor [Propioniciclava sp.]|uniref:response regulator transcription factor n=1 Tax=Propioniciclava sp. TaxID=2038686 RepID=UPI0039E5FDF0